MVIKLYNDSIYLSMWFFRVFSNIIIGKYFYYHSVLRLKQRKISKFGGFLKWIKDPILLYLCLCAFMCICMSICTQVQVSERSRRKCHILVVEVMWNLLSFIIGSKKIYARFLWMWSTISSTVFLTWRHVRNISKHINAMFIKKRYIVKYLIKFVWK